MEKLETKKEIAEIDAMRADMRAFVAMLREDGGRWVVAERSFGKNGIDPVVVQLAGGAIRLSGAIDRIDRAEDGTLRIIDYKTGSAFRYGPDQREYDGGRRLQHVLYAAAAETLYGEEISAAEYQFPSRRSENHRLVAGRHTLRAGLDVVDSLLGIVAAGTFHPTNNPDDCRFCEYAVICRAQLDEYDKVSSHMAEWARETKDVALKTLRELRRR